MISMDIRNEERLSCQFDQQISIGIGGFSKVISARNVLDQISYAIKVIKIKSPQNQTKLSLQLREPQIHSKLDHPNIIKYYDSWMESSNDEKKKNRQRLKSFTKSASKLKQSLEFLDEQEELDIKNNNFQEMQLSFSNDYSSDEDIDLEMDLDLKKEIFQQEFQLFFDTANILNEEHKVQQKKKIFQQKPPRLNLNRKQSLQSEEKQFSPSLQSVNSALYICIQQELCQQSLEQFIEQRNLKFFNDNNRKIDYEIQMEDFKIAYQLIDGLQYLEKMNIVHRDLKPSNILLDRQNNVKIADFGLAMYQQSDNDEYNFICGTSSYASPEQATQDSLKSVSIKSDIYPLAIIFLQLFFPVQTVMEYNIILKNFKQGILHDRIPSLFQQLLLKMTLNNPHKRASLKEIKETLNLLNNYNNSFNQYEDNQKPFAINSNNFHKLQQI